MRSFNIGDYVLFLGMVMIVSYVSEMGLFLESVDEDAAYFIPLAELGDVVPY